MITIHFHDPSIQSIFDSLESPPSLPPQFKTLPKSKDNDLIIINTLKSALVPTIPQDPESPPLDLLKVIKAIHEFDFSLFSDNVLVYEGKHTKEITTTQLELPDLPPQPDLLSLLKHKRLLQEDLNKTTQLITNQVEQVNTQLESKLKQLQSIKDFWFNLDSNSLDKHLDVITFIKSLEDISWPVLD